VNHAICKGRGLKDGSAEALMATTDGANTNQRVDAERHSIRLVAGARNCLDLLLVG
jgi:hypothetical protein